MVADFCSNYLYDHEEMDYQDGLLLHDPHHELLETSNLSILYSQLGYMDSNQMTPIYPFYMPLDSFNSAQGYLNHEAIFPLQTASSHMDFGSYYPSQYQFFLGNLPSLNSCSSLYDSHTSGFDPGMGHSYPSSGSHPRTTSEITSTQETMACVPPDVTQTDRNEYGLTQDFYQIMIQDETEVLGRRGSHESSIPQSSGQSLARDQDHGKVHLLNHSYLPPDSEPRVFESNADDGAPLSNVQQEYHFVDDYTDNSRYACSFKGCNQTFKRKEHAKRHFAAKHKQDRTGLVCEFCGKNTFYRADNLNAHRKLHARRRAGANRGVHFVPAAAAALQKKKRGRPETRKRKA